MSGHSIATVLQFCLVRFLGQGVSPSSARLLNSSVPDMLHHRQYRQLVQEKESCRRFSRAHNSLSNFLSSTVRLSLIATLPLRSMSTTISLHVQQPFWHNFNYINPSFTDWVQNVPRHAIFLNNSHWYRVTIFPIFLFVYFSPNDTT
jgi:hypothetical protein